MRMAAVAEHGAAGGGRGRGLEARALGGRAVHMVSRGEKSALGAAPRGGVQVEVEVEVVEREDLLGGRDERDGGEKREERGELERAGHADVSLREGRRKGIAAGLVSVRKGERPIDPNTWTKYSVRPTVTEKR